MAVYVSVGQRRRRLVISVAITLVIGLLLGFLIGITRTRSVDDRVASVRHDAADLATRVVAVDRQYNDALADSSHFFDQSVLRPLTDIQQSTVRLLNRAPWIVANTRRTLLDRLAALDQLAQEKAPYPQFTDLGQAAATDIRTTFGVPAT